MAQVEVSQVFVEVGWQVETPQVEVSQAYVEVGFLDIGPGQVEVHGTQIGVDAALDALVLKDEDADDVVFRIAGSLSVSSFPLRIYNKLGRDLLIESVFIAVNTQPVGTGTSIIVDVNKDGSSIFSSTNRPEITPGSNTDESIIIDTPEWADGEYLTVDIDAVGSTAEEGQDLTVHVRYR